MPETFRRKLATGSVRQSLYAMRTDLLPPQIREDSLAAWVMNFDSLRERPSEPQRDDRRSDLWAVDLFVTSSLQRQIPFYFAALFQIGRQWKVSEQAISDVEKASSTDNLRLSTRLTASRLRSRDRRLASLFGRESEVATEALTLLLKSSEGEHSARLRDARRWWSEWRAEVERLRHDVNRIGELASGDSGGRLWRELANLAVQSYRPSQLRMSLQAAGVTFPHHPEADVGRPAALYSELLSPLIFLAASQGKFRGPFFHEFAFEMRHVVHDVKEEIAYGESRRIALERLRRKYADTDPFERYQPLRMPADEELRNLILEHTVPGYGRTFSPWLATWKACVEYDSSKSQVVPANLRDDEGIVGFTRSADCAIKDGLPDHFLPGETWERLVQRLFERRWIEITANQMISSNENTDAGWTLDMLVTLIDRVTIALNEIGYRLSSPAIARVTTLWNKLHSDKRWTDTEW